MPDMYLPNTRVPELNGVASGGITVVLHRPEEMEPLYALAVVAPRPPSSPIASLAATLAEPGLDMHAWHREWLAGGLGGGSAYGRRMPSAHDPVVPSNLDEEEPTRAAEDMSDLTALKDSLAVLSTLWQTHSEDISALSCVVTLASPGTETVSWQTDRANMAFGGGSMHGWLGTGARSAVRFLTGLVVGGGIDAAARAPNLVDRARQRAMTAMTGSPTPKLSPPLRRLADLRPGEVEGKILVVLVHGLCSTDVGTFAELEAYLTGLPNVVVAGFPHDSLTTPIAANGKELAQQLVELGKGEVRLVCHSRGGLVAREACLWLQKRKRPDDQRWLHSCVTFGTPHLGTSVASSPTTLSALAMMGAHVNRSPAAASLADVLCGADGDGFVGVRELVPSSVKDSFLAGLEARENRLFLDDELDFRVFGAVARGDTIMSRLASAIVSQVLGTRQHDLLVPTSSAMPPLKRNTPGMPRMPLFGRSHFQYFSKVPAETGLPAHLTEAVNAMDLAPAATA